MTGSLSKYNFQKKDFTKRESFFCYVINLIPNKLYPIKLSFTSVFHQIIKSSNYQVLFFLLLLIPGWLNAKIDFNQHIKTIQNEIFNLHFKNAQTLIEQEKKANPKNTAIVACENNLDFMIAFLSEQLTDFEKMKSKSSARLDAIEGDTEEKNSPYYLNMQAELIFQRAILKALHNEMFSAALDTRKAFKMFEENHEKFPQFKPTLKGLGLMHAMIGCIPENYKWIASLAGLNGTIAQGTSELNECVLASVKNKELAYLKNETLLLLIYLETHFNKNIPAAYDLLKYYDTHTSQMITFSIANVFAADGKNDVALDTLLNMKCDANAYPLNYLNYMIGIGKLNRLDTGASSYFLNFVTDFKGKSFVKSAYQKLAWTGLLNNDTLTYNKYMDRLKTAGGTFSDEDKQALTEANSGIKPNLILLKARLLFDGGYYLKSLQQLVEKGQSEMLSQKDKIEFIYRIARNFDMLKQKEKAIVYYKNTITIGEQTTYYFAANAALNIAMIYEEKKDKTNAIAYYKKCLSMRNHEYQNSIDQRAKAGMNRLGAD